MEQYETRQTLKRYTERGVRLRVPIQCVSDSNELLTYSIGQYILMLVPFSNMTNSYCDYYETGASESGATIWPNALKDS